MTIDRFKLPNGNEFLYLKSSKNDIRNVLVLRGGDVLFLEENSRLRYSEDFVTELKNASPDDFSDIAEEYEVPYTGRDLYYRLRDWSAIGEYPAYDAGGSDVDRHIETAIENLEQAVNSAQDRSDKMKTINRIRSWCETVEQRVKNDDRS